MKHNVVSLKEKYTLYYCHWLYFSSFILSFGHCTEVRFVSLLYGVFTTMTVINPPEKKRAKRTIVHCGTVIEIINNMARHNLIDTKYQQMVF